MHLGANIGLGYLGTDDVEALRRAVSFPVDATSGKGVPLTQAEWDAVFAAAGVASKTVHSSWGFQDASGNIVATVGTNLTAYGSATYQGSVTGWSRKAFRLTENPQGAGFASGTGPNPGSNSVLWFSLADLTANPGVPRIFLSGGNAGTAHCRALAVNGAAGVVRIACNGVSTDGSLDHRTGGVRPYVLKYNRTGSEAKLFSDIEKITGTYSSAVTDSTKGFPANGTTTGPAQDVVLGACFEGANAEWSDADIKAVLQAMNWSIGWS